MAPSRTPTVTSGPQPSSEPYKADWPVHPGIVLRAELDARGIAQADVAARTGLTAKHINQLVQGLVGLSSDVAVLLERSLGIDSETWTTLEVQFQHARSRQQAGLDLASYEEWATHFPRQQLIKLAIIEPADRGSTVVEKVLRFFEVASPDTFDGVWLTPVAAFRRSQKHKIDPYATALWLRLAEVKAGEMTVPPLRIGALRKAAAQLPPLTRLSFRDGFRRAQQILGAAGVRLLFVEEIDRTRVCGATRWLSADRPLIALTNRHKYADIFWFSLLHEVGHILLHPRRATFVEIDGDHRDDDTAETQADDFAAELLLPQIFNATVRSFTSSAAVRSLAASQNIGDNIVAGRHGTLTGQWRVFGALRPRVDAVAELSDLGPTT